MMWEMHGLGFNFGWIFMLAFWVLIILGITALLSRSDYVGKSGDANENPALRILEERYAKGEIDKKEFEEKKKDLS